jgi:methionine aminotransferase
MATEHNAINLSQGFPDFPLSPELIDGVHHYMKQGMNQYAPMPGVPILRQRIAEKLNRAYDISVDMDTEITVTAGAIEALNSSITALINPGDEVVIMDPAYDAYEPIINLNGGKAVAVSLRQPDYSIDWEGVKACITGNTRMILVNSPHNPSGAIISATDLKQLEEITRGTEILVLSDEVYEHIVFDGQKHQSVLRSPELRKRSVVTYSFGKTFHATGWRIGYMIAPSEFTSEIRKVHQYNTFTIHTPTQYAIADHLENPDNYESIAAMYQQKRDYFLEHMAKSRFKPVTSGGTYFQLMDYSAISDMPDLEMAEWLTKKHKVATIPMSVFYKDRQDNKVLRFCLAKGEETLKAAADILCKI